MISNLDLIKLLIDYNVLNKERIDVAVDSAEKKGLTLYSEIVESNLVSPDHLVKLVTEFLDVPRVDLSTAEVSTKIVQLIPERTARELKVLAYAQVRGKIRVAISDPQDTNIEKELRNILKRSFSMHLTTPSDIMRQMLLYKKTLKETFSEMIQKTTKEAKTDSLAEAPIVKIIDTLLD